jgi:hypothetical protein
MMPMSNESDEAWHPTHTIDGVVAANILRLREEHELSRAALAKRLTETTGSEWTAWRIIDLEGKRSPERPPSPVAWAELVALAVGFDVTIYELVLPADRDDFIEVATPSATSPGPYGHTLTMSESHDLDVDEYALMLFRIPRNVLTSERLEASAKRLGYEQEVADIDRHRADIEASLTELLETFKRLQAKEGTTDGINA